MTSNLRISPHEISSCGAAAQIVGVGGFREGSLFALKFAYDTGDTQILCLNDHAIQHLVVVLKSLAVKLEAIDALDILVELPSGAIRVWSPH
jgi:hypothetical protein